VCFRARAVVTIITRREGRVKTFFDCDYHVFSLYVGVGTCQ
jgi:hypothetical protein